MACKLHEINPAVLKVDALEVPKQDGRIVLYKTCKYDTDLVSARGKYPKVISNILPFLSLLILCNDNI